MTDLAERRGETDQVYQPAEDSHLLAETVAADLSGDERVLDVGTGSGYVGAHLAEAGASVVGSDRNPHACRQAREAGVETVRANFTHPFRAGVFDAVCFNPPYLPTPPELGGDDWMELALSGGESGRAVVEPFLDDVGRVLAPGGVVYLLLSTLTGLDAVREYAADAGFTATTLAEESFPFETLTVLRLWR